MKDIVLSGVSVAFGDNHVYTDFTYTFHAGTFTSVMGPSGCGKTTLLSLLAGSRKPDAGTVIGLPARIGCVFQENRLCEDFSALSNIRLVTGRTMPDTEICFHLRAIGLGDVFRNPVKTFSGGMQRRVAIVRAVCYNGDLLLLDEPFKGLDTETRKSTMAYVREYSKGKTVICVTHDAAVADYFAGERLLLQKAN